MSDNLAAVILSGGKSTRFRSKYGQHKAIYRSGNKPFLLMLAEQLYELTENIFLNTSSIDQFKKFTNQISSVELQPLVDDTSLLKSGPLKGILTAARSIDFSNCIFAAVDYPFVKANDLQILLQNLDHYDTEISSFVDEVFPTFSLFAIRLNLFKWKIDDYIDVQDQRLSSIFRGSYACTLCELPDLPHRIQNVNRWVPDPNEFIDFEPTNLETKVIRPGRHYWIYHRMRIAQSIPTSYLLEQLEMERKNWENTGLVKHIDRDIKVLEKKGQ